MNHFLSLADVDDPLVLVEEALRAKRNPSAAADLGARRTLTMLFLNPSLRTRLSTQKAAQNLGMNVMVLNVGSEGWNLETEDGVVMDGDRQEHIREAAAVVSGYSDLVAIRAFASLKDREIDYSERFLAAFVQHATVPVVNMESATRHPLQSLADAMTIEEHRKGKRPTVVLTWAPHPRALPQAVANSFLEWMKVMDVDLKLTHPDGYGLAAEFAEGIPVISDQREAFEGADFIYAKNWSALDPYGAILPTERSWTVTSDLMALTRQARFMHCLPVRRNVIVTDEVLDSDASIVLEQARNREFSAQAVLARLLA